MDYSEIERKLMSALSIKRYIHTKGVVKEATKLALLYGTDKKKTRLAALLHDCAKDYPDDMKRRFLKEYHVEVDDVIMNNIDLSHALLGVEVARREYNVEDEEVLDAIRYHTTGKADMSLISKIIFIADYIEENRKHFEGLEQARKVAYEDINKSMAKILEGTIKFIKDNNRALHPLSCEAFEFYKRYI